MVTILGSYGPSVNAITHTAPHHADEVFATAMLAILSPVILYRTRDKKIIDNSDATVYIYDVGGEYDPRRKHFDHHQKGFSEARRNGIKYSSAGLIWREYGVEIVKKLGKGEPINNHMAASIAARVDRTLIKGIDARDNGQSEKESVMSVSSLISLIRPRWCEKEVDEDSYFLTACELADFTLRCAIDNAIATEYGVREVQKAFRTINGPILVLDEYIGGWMEAILRSDMIRVAKLLYIIFPAPNGGWNVQTIPKSLSEAKEPRKRFPESWCGLEGEKLVEATGVRTAVFCHVDGFIATAETKEDAVLLAEKAINT